MKIWLTRIFAWVAGLLIAALAVAAIALFAISASMEPSSTRRAEVTSRLVVDRDGRLLRAYATPDGVWRLPVTPDQVDPRFLALLKAAEDKRFDTHMGVDPLALARAAWQFVRHGRVVSGGSTLTMQVARLIEPRTERGLATKVRQILRAVELERRFTKTEILTLYLTLAPYGGNIEGIRAASLAYFGKEPRRLTSSEAALLVALPQSPEARRPDRFPERAAAARERVLERGVAAGLLPADDHERAVAEAVPRARRPVPMHAAHLADRLVGEERAAGVVRTSLEHRLQVTLEQLVRERIVALGPRLSAAIIVVDVATGEVRAHVASPGYLDAERRGAVDMTSALRSPGSALKPFVYALAFESGLAHPETLIEDRPLRLGGYAPENFDQGHQGLVTVRRALQMSLNVPVVELLAELRPARLTGRLTAAGAAIALPRDEAPGLAVGLGGLGITLEDLARLYVGLARGGTVPPLATAPVAARPPGRHLVDPVSAWYVADILRGAPPPDGHAGGRVAYKTGTSYGYRDAWAVGFDRRSVVAAWVGRADGAPVAGLTGRASAAPLLFEAFARLGRSVELIPAPPGALLVSGRALPAPLRGFGAAAESARTDGHAAAADPRLRIAYPPDGARLDRAGEDSVILRASGGVPPLVWLVDGAPVGASGPRRTFDWRPPGRGFLELTVIDARGESARVSVRVE
jgi:penicillin-binding protein 1C